jgi:hypothetical protein
MGDDFMSNFDALKVKKDIEDLKDKKQTLLISLENDIKGIDSQILKEFCIIGKKAYDLNTEGKDSLAALAEEFTKINDFKAAQEAKKVKMTEISARYDDEITILEKLVPQEAPPSFCMNCGKPYKAGDAFCMGCGTKTAS